MKRHWIIGLTCVVLAVGFAFFFWKHRVAGDRENGGGQANTGHEEEATAGESAAELRPSPLGQAVEIGEHVIGRQRVAKRANGPVKFYAKVVDQNGAPVPDAVLTGAVSSYNEGLLVKDEDAVRTSKFQVRSDVAGQFAVTNLRGWSLHIDDLEKQGYFWRNPGFGSFGVGGRTPTRIPSYSSPAQPLVLYMWKKGATEPVIQHGFRFFAFKEDVFAVNLVTGQRVATNESADFVFRFPRFSEPDRAARAHRTMVLEVPGGGILETMDKYPFFAAPDGYQPQWRWIYLAADTPPGQEDWVRHFYVRSRGSQLCAGLKVTFDLPVITIEVIVNPTGSPALEPDPEKQITDPEEIRRLDEATRQ